MFPVQLKASVLQHVPNGGLDSAGGLEFADLVVGIDWWMTPGEIFVGRGGVVVEACRIHAERGEYVKLRVRPLETYDQGSGNCLDLRGQPNPPGLARPPA